MAENISQIPQGQPEQVSFGAVQHNFSDILPTSSEIGHLWSTYLAESMSVCFLKTYVAQSKDQDIRPILQKALDVSTQRIQDMETIFNSCNHPIPNGFDEKDDEPNARQLFSESFALMYTRLMHKFVIIYYSHALTVCSRSDIRSFFSNCIITSHEILQKSTEVLLGKGLLTKHPGIVIPDRVDFVHDKSYFGKLIGKQRPLNALEMSYLFSMMEIKQLLRTLKLGYSQVVKSEKVRTYVSTGKQIADKQIEILSSFLEDEDIPQPTITETLVTDSKESPLSDKLILSHITVVVAYIIVAYGLAEINSSRADLINTYRGFITELLAFAKDGAELMIEAGWLERVPQTADRRELIH